MGLSSRGKGLGFVLALGVAVTALPRAADREAFPSVRPASREQAVAVLSGGGGVRSLTPLILSNWGDPDAVPAVRRALGVLGSRVTLPRERQWTLPDGTLLRYTTTRGSFDRLDGSDADRDGRADVLQAAADGIALAREQLVGQLGLPQPEPIEVLLVHIGGNVDGYLVPTAGRSRIVLEASAGAVPEDVRRAAIRQYAFAVALAAGPAPHPAWCEAFATWAEMRLTGGPHAELAALLSQRLHRLSEGLRSNALDLASGNALWLAFLEESFGPSVVRLTLEELSAGGTVAQALDHAVRRGAGTNLASALRDFQLWGVLVGDRSDRQHFSFAERLDSPRYAVDAEGLPALSVRAAAPVAALGGSVVRLRPDAAEGGLRVYFEGDFSTTWEADLLLVGTRGALRRVPLPLGPEGRGEVKVPLPGLAEALLLVRNVGPDEEARRYSWAADLERGFPFELTSLSAEGRAEGAPGALVTWETRGEQHLVGFNVLRYRDGGAPVRVNPVWIPAVGGESEPTSYQYVDVGAEVGVSYVYRVQGITLEGLPALSDPVAATTPR